jgi:hypothetical protein
MQRSVGAHLLWSMGAAALKPFKSGKKLMPPRIGYAQAMRLREEFYKEGQTWPYEHIVPGVPKPPLGVEAYLLRQEAAKKERQRRAKEIQDAMQKMPELIAQHKELLRLDWEEVTQLDKLTLSRSAIKRKYINRRLAKHG